MSDARSLYIHAHVHVHMHVHVRYFINYMSDCFDRSRSSGASITPFALADHSPHIAGSVG